MIFERHMSSLCGPLPFTYRAPQMRINDIKEAKVEIEGEPIVDIIPRTSDTESRKSKIQTTEEAIQYLKQGLGIRILRPRCY